MTEKPDQDGKDNKPVGLPTDVDGFTPPPPPDTDAALAAITDVKGVHFWREFVQQYAKQQGYDDERKRLLEAKAYDAIGRYEQGLEGAKLRLVSHIDGMAIDDPAKRHREAFLMLTNANEFNAFLEAIGEQERWHDPSQPKPKRILETPSKNPSMRYDNPLDNIIYEAIRQAGGVDAKPKKVMGILENMAQPADGSQPTAPFTELRWPEGKREWVFMNNSDTPESKPDGAMRKAVVYRIKKLKEDAFEPAKLTHGGQN